MLIGHAGILASQAAASSFPKVNFASNSQFTRSGYQGGMNSLVICTTFKALESPISGSKVILRGTNSGSNKNSLHYTSTGLVFKVEYQWTDVITLDPTVENSVVFSVVVTTAVNRVTQWLVNGVYSTTTESGSFNNTQGTDLWKLGDGANFILGNFALWRGTSIDLSNSTNQAKFWSGGAIVPITDDGTTAVGSAANILCNQNAATINNDYSTTTGIKTGTWTVVGGIGVTDA